MRAMRAPSSLFLTLLACACGADGQPSADQQGNEPTAPANPEAPPAPKVKVAGNAAQYLAHLQQLVERAEAAGETTIAGVGDDVLLVKELRSLTAGPFWGEAAQTASRAPKADRRDPLPAIVAYHGALQAAGIDWVFVPVPAKVAVDPSLVPDAPAVDGRIDVHCVAFYERLREAGVPVLDVLPALHALVQRGQRAHCRTDTHWTPAACAEVARLVRERVAGKPWLADAATGAFDVVAEKVTITGDMAAMRTATTRPESLDVEVVQGARTSDTSPVLLFGDSHCLVFHSGGDMHTENAGLPDHLMRELGMPITVVGVRGSGATPSRVDAFRGGKFEGKKFAIWCLTAREFTEGQGWAEVPVKR